MLVIPTVLLALAAAGQAGGSGTTVVVNGYSARAMRERVQRCLARDCGAFDYANDVLAAANTAFVAGDYDTARALLNDAVRHLDRIKGPAKARVAIFTAQSLVAEHQGDRRDAVGAYARAIYALHQAGPATLATEVLTRIDLGDLFVRTDRDLDAQRTFRRAAALAGKSGSDDLRAAVAIHEAVFDFRNGETRRARTRLQAIIDSPAPLGAGTRLAAAAILARIARASGDMKPTEALLARSALQPAGEEPVLVYAPPLEEPAGDFKEMKAVDEQHLAVIEWADIGYWIRPSGRVESVEVLRGSRERSWLGPIRDGIGRRVYLAATQAADGNGHYMVERFTLGFPRVVPIGSLIPRRTGVPTVTELRLARSDAPPPPVDPADR